jgi:nicotinamide-nucleotide amidase
MDDFKYMQELQNVLRNNNYTITCAESCTGGLISSYITKVSGSSEIFKGSVITYSNEIKEQELKVSKEIMIKHGVVSIEVVNEMLDGVLKKFNAEFAIAVSGVAGPNGGTKDKPVGTVVIGIKGIMGINDVQIYHIKGCREEVQKQSANIAFEVLFSKLINL